MFLITLVEPVAVSETQFRKDYVRSCVFENDSFSVDSYLLISEFHMFFRFPLNPRWTVSMTKKKAFGLLSEHWAT